MKKSLLSLLLALVPVALFGASGTAIPGGNQATPFVINKPGAYYLAANRVMTGNAYGAIEINAPDVTLDLNGYALSVSDINGYSHCITITSSASNAEIRNGSLHTAPGEAIKSSGEGLRVIDVRIADTGGVYAEGENALFERCHITDNHGGAIYLGGRGSVVRNCSVKNASGDGAYGLYLGSNISVTDCSIGFIEGYGIYCGGSGCVIENNDVYEANAGKVYYRSGIGVSTNSIVRGNTVSRCYAAGISVTNVGCVVEKNIINRTQAASPMVGAAIVLDNNSAILRGNIGTRNDGPLTAGAFVDGGDNIGD